MRLVLLVFLIFSLAMPGAFATRSALADTSDTTCVSGPVTVAGSSRTCRDRSGFVQGARCQKACHGLPSLQFALPSPPAPATLTAAVISDFRSRTIPFDLPPPRT